MTYEKVAVTGGLGLLGSHVMRRLSKSIAATSIDIKEPQISDEPIYKHVKASITNFEEIKAALKGHDAVIHLAAIPNPRETDMETTFNVNVQGAWTVLQAAEEVGIRRVVVASSDSVFGFSYNPPDWPPQFLPVDESHPTRPTEVYSLSKKVTEAIAESYAARGKMEIIVIRPCHIIFPRGYSEITTRGRDIQNYHFWAWIDPEDVAQAFELAALSPEYKGYQIYTVAAEEGLNEQPTLELAKQRWGKLPVIRQPEVYQKNLTASVLDTAKIREHLGFEASVNLKLLKQKVEQLNS
ncbi:MAG: hypothetical protein CMM58_08720 [Rhodospirillaceae bacterium]|nr:hypothetical protein [Rhodospirillaceae bacterium]|tara:strand:- start:606 stop:1493 length:888 start_codon:yes stop_codon:yes gene_type:complete